MRFYAFLSGVESGVVNNNNNGKRKKNQDEGFKFFWQSTVGHCYLVVL